MKKFDFVISNPPYQDDTAGNKTFAPSVYNKIMEAAFKIADKAAFITPARFLFDAGATPRACW
ncbi:MAG: Eco57I restriction-modification methylase domain-containing protein [Selenomonadaceae bacterium]|nr:Eco57I restriction-modification methylase domain-containing protein [Selenomonadaceae bacterium]